MIITCHKCTTSFDLDDSLVKESGSKVRCSVCKEIFTVYPLSMEPEVKEEPAPELYLEPGSDPESDGFEDSGDFEDDDMDFSLDDSDADTDPGDGLSMGDSGLRLEEDGTETGGDTFSEGAELSFEDDGFEMEEDSDDSEDTALESEEMALEPEGMALEEDELDFDDDAVEFETDESEADFDSIEFEPIDDDDDSFSLEMEESVTPLEMDDEPAPPEADDQGIEDVSPIEAAGEEEDEFELEFDVEDDDKEIPTLDDLEAEGTIEPALSLETGPAEEDGTEAGDDGEAAPVITPEDDFSQYDEVLAQETEPDDTLLEGDTTDTKAPEPSETEPQIQKPDPLIEAAPASRRKKSGSAVGKPVLILLLLFLLLIGAYIASIMTGYKIPYLSDIQIPIVEEYLGKTTKEVKPPKPVPNQKSVNGRFVTNASAGTLFVITGRVENPSNVAYNHIQIQGALITEGKKEAKIKKVFCGNIIPEDMLANGNISDINTQLLVKDGAHKANVNIKPGGSVPFMVVFSDLPEKLQNFTVKVAAFEKAGAKK